MDIKVKKRGNPNPVRQFQKGNKAAVGHGRPKIDPVTKQLRQLTNTKFQQIVNKYLHLSAPELASLKQNPDLTALDLAVINILVQSINKADHIRFQFLLERTIGKVPDKVEVSEVEKSVDEMSVDELLENIEKAKEVLSANGIDYRKAK